MNLPSLSEMNLLFSILLRKRVFFFTWPNAPNQTFFPCNEKAEAFPRSPTDKKDIPKSVKSQKIPKMQLQVPEKPHPCSAKFLFFFKKKKKLSSGYITSMATGFEKGCFLMGADKKNCPWF